MGGQKYTPKMGGFRPKLASHEGIFKFCFFVFHPSPQTPAQPRTTVLSNCFIRVVSDQSTVLK